MSTQPIRRRTTAISRSTTTGTNSNSNSFWGTLAGYASELAPVAGPLLDAIGQTANAIDRAEQRSRYLEAAAPEEEEEDWNE